MARQEDMYIANLSFLLYYENGRTDDEIHYEIFKMAFQDKETVHYDRSKGGNFKDLEQEKNHLSTAMWFTSNMIESVYMVNKEKNNDPYIILGYNNIKIIDDTNDTGEYIVEVSYSLLDDMAKIGTLRI